MKGQTSAVISAIAVVIIVAIGGIILQSVATTSSSDMCATGTWNTTVKDCESAAVCNAATVRADSRDKCCLTYNTTMAACKTVGTASGAWNAISAGASSLSLGNIFPLVIIAGAVITFLVASMLRGG